MSENNILLGKILKELEKLNSREGESDLREWYPLFFTFYVKGAYVDDDKYGANKWGFKKMNNDDLKYDFDYQFNSLTLHTEARSYKPALRMVINGKNYPETQIIVSNENDFNNWQEFLGHNYSYQRAFQFSLVESYQSNFGYGQYPFKMLVKANWTLNFEIFMATNSLYWHTLEIEGWKIHETKKERISELEDLVIKLNV